MESKEGLWTNPHVPDRVLCRLWCADRWSFDEENIWEFWIRRARLLQIPSHYHLITMPIMILNRLTSGFTARSVGSETWLSGSWICMLLSIAVSHFRKNDIFDNLMVVNIIQQGMEHVTSNGARISCVISRHSFSNFWWEWISFARNWCLMHKYTANKVLRSRNSMYLVNFRLSVASTHRPRKSDSPLKPKYFRQCENQA